MVVTLTDIGLLLLIAAIAAMLTRRLGLPYTVGLVLAGIGLAMLPVTQNIRLSKELIFSVLLPPLVFEAALAMHWREFKADLPAVTTLATVGVALAAAVTAAGMHYWVGWGWGTAVLFGVLIAATDPVSVIATFKEAGVTGRLRLLVEAESLLNDGTAAVGLSVVLALVSGDAPGYGKILQMLILSVGGGIAIGVAVGSSLMLLAGRSLDHLVQITFTTLAAYGSFLLAEHVHCSGILASLSAGLVVGNFGHFGSLSPVGRAAVESFWEYVTFVANSVIFILIGFRTAEQHFREFWFAALAAIVLVIIGRAVAIYPTCALFNYGRRPIERPHQHVLFWGGLRGALALALALGLPDSVPQRDAIVSAAFAVVSFSIFLQGLTMTPLLRALKQLPPKHAVPPPG
jgi:CPA1 family monovalent cation:H+ antiporter